MNTQLKDYYKTLGIQPSATALQVKQSFRQLALRHHPVKNPGNAIAAAMFMEIQEAYETLSDPGKREEYNYKRWYNRTLKKEFNTGPVTAGDVLAEIARLYNYIRTANTAAIDFDGLSYHIRQLLNDNNIALLQQAEDTTVARQAIDKLLMPVSALPYRYIEPIAVLLQRIAGDNREMQEKITFFTRQQFQKSNWQKYRLVVVVLVTLLLCCLIYWIS